MLSLGCVQANIHSILASEREVNELLEGIDRALDALTVLEDSVKQYDDMSKVRQCKKKLEKGG